jgi:hypothetical protein
VLKNRQKHASFVRKQRVQTQAGAEIGQMKPRLTQPQVKETVSQISFIWASFGFGFLGLDTDSCSTFSTFSKLSFPEFFKEPSPSKLVNGTKIGFQNMVNGTKFVLHIWLAEQKMSFKIC